MGWGVSWGGGGFTQRHTDHPKGDRDGKLGERTSPQGFQLRPKSFRPENQRGRGDFKKKRTQKKLF